MNLIFHPAVHICSQLSWSEYTCYNLFFFGLVFFLKNAKHFDVIILSFAYDFHQDFILPSLKLLQNFDTVRYVYEPSSKKKLKFMVLIKSV